MKVKELIEKLKKQSLDSEVNIMWEIKETGDYEYLPVFDVEEDDDDGDIFIIGGKQKENKEMDNITVITLNANDEQIETRLTVNELIHAWYHDIDIPTNDDTVVSCVLGHTTIYVETFGELMMFLTGEC